MSDRIEEIFKRTVDLVRHEQPTWVAGRNENEFRADYGAASLVVGKPNGAAPYFNVSKGKDVLATYNASNSAQAVSDLYETVRKQALNVDDTLDALLTELG